MQILAHAVLLVNDKQNIPGFRVDSMRHPVYVPSVDQMRHHGVRASGPYFFRHDGALSQQIYHFEPDYV
jgi:hypothetical protein